MRTFLTRAAVALLGAAAIAQSPLTTTFANNNFGSVGGAVYFDLTVNVPVTITGIDVNLGTVASTPGSVDVYTCPTTYVGNEANASAWTLVGSGTVTSAGAGLPSALTLAGSIPLGVGATGVAYVGIGHSFSYTNGTGTNQTYSTAEMTLQAGAAVNVAFTGVPFTPRVVNTRITYVNGGSGTVATKTSYGAGCVAKSASVYEHFLTTPSIDLSNTALTMINTGTGYLVLPGTTAFLAPSGSATNLNLTDDSEVTITLPSAFTHPGGSTTTLNVCSNGHISTASNGAAFDYTPTPAEFLAWTNATWAAWRDLIPSGTANVFYEVVGNIAYVTWNGVVGYVGTTMGVTPSTFQFQFDLTTGSVHLVFQSLDTVSISGWTGGEGWIVGYSPAGPSLNPGSTDLSALVALVLPGADLAALAMVASARPIGGTTINFDTSNIPTSAPFGAITLGLANPAFDLTGIGMPGCTQYTDNLVTLLFFPGGGTTASLPFTVPNVIGVTIKSQSLVYAPAAGLTPLGAIASNGVSLLIGNL